MESRPPYDDPTGGGADSRVTLFSEADERWLEGTDLTSELALQISDVFPDLFSAATLRQVLVVVIALAVAFLLDTFVRRYIKSEGRKRDWDPQAVNFFRLAWRILVYFVAAAFILQFQGIPEAWIVGLSTVGGVIIGFASNQTLGNLLAGIYILLSKPFLVGDFVRIADQEGEVKEITLNYTRLYTPNYDILRIPNRQVLDNKITVHSRGEEVDYTFELGFRHDVPMWDVKKKCIEPAIQSYYDKHKDWLTRKPEYYMTSVNWQQKTFGIRVFFNRRDILRFYDTGNELSEDMLARYDKKKEEMDGGEPSKAPR